MHPHGSKWAHINTGGSHTPQDHFPAHFTQERLMESLKMRQNPQILEITKKVKHLGELATCRCGEIADYGPQVPHRSALHPGPRHICGRFCQELLRSWGRRPTVNNTRWKMGISTGRCPPLEKKHVFSCRLFVFMALLEVSFFLFRAIWLHPVLIRAHIEPYGPISDPIL